MSGTERGQLCLNLAPDSKPNLQIRSNRRFQKVSGRPRRTQRKNIIKPCIMGSVPWPFIPAGVQPMGAAEAQGGSALPVCTSGTGGSGRLKLRALSRGRRVVARASFGLPGGFFSERPLADPEAPPPPPWIGLEKKL